MVLPPIFQDILGHKRVGSDKSGGEQDGKRGMGEGGHCTHLLALQRPTLHPRAECGANWGI